MARNDDNQQVAVLAPQRMEMPAHVRKEYGLNPDTWRALTDAIFPLAKTVGGVLLALAYCKQRNLDPFARVVHIVPMKVGNREVETVWPGIGLQRITGHRQPDFDGWDDCEFGPEETFVFKGKKQVWANGQKSGFEDIEVKLTVPQWARFTFYKIRNGRRLALPGPKVWFTETFSPISPYCPVPNARWERAPRQMIEKCAEAAALRRGWPDVFGDEASFEEIEGKPMGGGSVQGEFSVVDEAKPAAPTRADIARDAQVDEDGVVQDEVVQGDQGDDEAVTGDPAEDVGDGPSLAEQVEQHAAREQQGDPAEQTKVKPVRTVRDKPELFETWDEWEASVATRMKTAANLPKLDQVTKDAKAEFDVAPDENRQNLIDLYDLKAADHRAAMQ